MMRVAGLTIGPMASLEQRVANVELRWLAAGWRLRPLLLQSSLVVESLVSDEKLLDLRVYLVLGLHIVVVVVVFSFPEGLPLRQRSKLQRVRGYASWLGVGILCITLGVVGATEALI